MSGRATCHVHAHALDQGTRVLPPLPASRRLGLACARRRPRFRYRGVVKTDADHTLCFQCYWPNAGHGRDAWDRVLGRAMLLHGDAKAPWE